MRILAVVILLAVASKAEINKLFFSGPDVSIDCPGEGTFYQWKKYYSNQMTNLLSADKRLLNISLNAKYSPITYSCSGTNGFTNYNDNITVYVLDQQSDSARKQCFMEKSATEPTPKYPCFLQQQADTIVRVSMRSSVDLDCEAGGTNVTYIWYRLNTPKSHQELMIQYNNVPVIKIDDIDDKLVGQYLCIVNTTSRSNVKRYFDLQISQNQSTRNSMIVISGPFLTNVTVKFHSSHTMSCQADALEMQRIHLIQWAKKIDLDAQVVDKSLTIKWGDSLYKLIPENQVQSSKLSESNVVTSLELKAVTGDSAGYYICAFFTNDGKMTHKTFFLTVEDSEINDGTQRSFLFLYILIPSLIIAVCLFVGIYLTINRRSTRKGSSLGTGTTASNCCKSENEVARLRTTPEYSMNSYPASAQPTTQYLVASNYPSSYYQTPAKIML